MTAHRGRGWPLVILAGFILLLGVTALVPLYDIFAERSDEAAQARQDLAVYRSQIAALPRLKVERAAVDAQEARNAALLHGDNTALAAADMQSRVKALVERHDGQVRSAQALAASASNGMEKIEMQFDVSLPLGSLEAATYELETGTPYFFLDNVEIHPEMYASRDTPSDLRVLWTVHGYRKAGTP